MEKALLFITRSNVHAEDNQNAGSWPAETRRAITSVLRIMCDRVGKGSIQLIMYCA